MEVYLFKLTLSQAFFWDGFMEELTISEVAKRAGIRASAIRYYESIHLLPPPRRSAGRRRYNSDVYAEFRLFKSPRLLV